MAVLGTLEEMWRLILHEVYGDGNGPLETLGKWTDNIPDPITYASSQFVGIANPLAGAQILSENKGIMGLKDIPNSIISNSPIGVIGALTGVNPLSMNPMAGALGMNTSNSGGLSDIGKSIRNTITDLGGDQDL